MAAETHVQDASAARRAKEAHVHDGAAVRAAKEIWVHDGVAARKVFAGGFASYVSPLACQGQTYADSGYGSAGCVLSILPNGTWSIDGFNFGALAAGNWGNPTTPGLGADHYVRFTLEETSGSTSNTSWTSTTGWLQIGTGQTARVTAEAPTANRSRSARYTVQIATDAAGANVVSTTTGVTLSAAAKFGTPP